jgi:RNA polymerase, sigma subunit, ECF family
VGRRPSRQPPRPRTGARCRAGDGQRFQGLEKALARLPPEHREILLLREIEEMSYEDIAAVLQLNIGTVKSRIARARAGLLEKMPR